MANAQNNPPWDEAEIVLAMNLYFNHESNTKHGSQDEFKALSKTLRSLNIHNNIANLDKFRNVNGVRTKIANLMSLDESEASKGLDKVSKRDKEIWDKYCNNIEELRNLAEAITSSLTITSNTVKGLDPESNDETEFPEGRYFYRLHRVRERNKTLIDQVKRLASARGSLRCCICDFCFEEKYGEIGKDFIECHHVKPLSEYKPNEQTSISDLVLVCSNCHKMIHRKRPWLTTDALCNILC